MADIVGRIPRNELEKYRLGSVLDGIVMMLKRAFTYSVSFWNRGGSVSGRVHEYKLTETQKALEHTFPTSFGR